MTAPTMLGSPTTTTLNNSSRNSALANAAIPGSEPVLGPPKVQMSDKAKAQIVSWIKEQYTKSKTARQIPQKQWYMNLAMYYGRQYLEYLLQGNNMMATLGVPKASKSRVRHTVNIIRPMIRTEIARMTSQKPSSTVIPATTSDEDMFAAQAGEQVWEYLQQRRNFQTMLRRNAFWIAIAGTGFIKTWWDPDYVDTLSLSPVTGKPVQGDIRYGVSTPFNIFVPDLMAEDIEDEPFVIEAYTKPVEWVKHFWKVDVNPDSKAQSEIIDTHYMGVPADNSSSLDSVLVIEAWIKPGATSILPDGGMVTVINDKLVQGPVEFYSHKEYPYTKFEHIPTGKFYGDSVLVDVNPLQKEYNRSRSEIIESKRRMARPQLLYAIGSIDPNKVTNEPGLLIPYRPGLPTPTPLPLQSLPSYVIQEQDRIKADFEDITGQHSVSRGQAPGSGVTAATAISFLQERDDSIMGMTYNSIEKGTEKIARQSLQLVVDYWTLPRTIGVTGLDQSFDSLELKGSEISNGRNVRVEGGSSLPTSKAARQALLMDMYKSGAITADQMLDLLEVGGVNKLVERIRVDLRQAQRENLKMKRITPDQYQAYMQQTAAAAAQGLIGTTDPDTGAPTVLPDQPSTYPPMIPVHKYDNHAVHVAAHNNYRKSQEFDMQPDYVKIEFEKHVSLHEQAMQQQQRQNAMLAMGGPPNSPPVGGGNESPPPMSNGGGAEPPPGPGQ